MLTMETLVLTKRKTMDATAVVVSAQATRHHHHPQHRRLQALQGTAPRHAMDTHVTSGMLTTETRVPTKKKTTDVTAVVVNAQGASLWCKTIATSRHGVDMPIFSVVDTR